MNLPKKEDELFLEIKKLRNDVQTELNQKFQNFNDYEDLYWGYINNSKNAWKSKVFDPESFSIVERMTSHLTASNPRGKFYPMDDKGDVIGARIADEVFKYQWGLPKQDMRSKIKRTVKGAGIFGISIGVLDWRYETKKKTRIEERIDEETGEMKQFEIEENVVTCDYPYYKDLYIYDCFPDLAATCIEDMEYFMHDEYVTYQQLEVVNNKNTNVKRYKNLGKLKEKLADPENKVSVDVDSYRQRVSSIEGNAKSEIKGRFKITRIYTRDRWVTIATDFDLVLEDRPNPHDHGDLPVHIFVDHEYPNQVYGRGEIEPIARLQKGLNNVLNQRLDNVRMNLASMFSVKYNAQYAHTWKIKPGQMWYRGDKDDIQPMSVPDVTGNTFIQTVNYFKDAIAKTGGYLDMLTRNETSVERTATEISKMAGEQNARMRSKEANLDSFIRRLANQWMQLNAQYLTSEKMIRIVGKEAIQSFINETNLDEQSAIYQGQEVPKFTNYGDYGMLIVEPKDLFSEYDYITEQGSTTSEDSDQEVQKMMMVYRMAQEAKQSGILQAEGQDVKLSELLRKLFYRMGVENVDQIFEAIEQPQVGMAQDPAMQQDLNYYEDPNANMGYQ